MFGVHEICHKFFIVWHYVTPLSSQVKVREATSNDPWGPSSTQMSEIADLTYNMVSLPLFIVLASSKLLSGGVLWNNADDLETIEWPRQELATCLQGFGAPWVSYKDWQWKGKDFSQIYLYPICCKFICTQLIAGGPAVQGKYICNPDPEGLPVCRREQGPGAECQGEGKGHGITPEGNNL